MSLPALEIKISDAAKALLGRIEDRAGLLRAIGREMDVQNQLTVGHLMAKRLHGKGPFPVSEHRLGEVSREYRNRLRASKAVVSGDTVQSAIGTSVKYGAIHEFGGTIKRVMLAGSVRLATDRRGNLLRQGKNGKLAVFASAKRKTATTVAFAGGKRYEVTIPARAPITHGIRDRLPEIGVGVSNAIITFWNKGSGGTP